MAWTFFCQSDQTMMSADSKEELADQVQQHVNDMHDRQISREQAMDLVNKGAKQTAA